MIQVPLWIGRSAALLAAFVGVVVMIASVQVVANPDTRVEVYGWGGLLAGLLIAVCGGYMTGYLHRLDDGGGDWEDGVDEDGDKEEE